MLFAHPRKKTISLHPYPPEHVMNSQNKITKIRDRKGSACQSPCSPEYVLRYKEVTV